MNEEITISEFNGGIVCYVNDDDAKIVFYGKREGKIFVLRFIEFIEESEIEMIKLWVEKIEEYLKNSDCEKIEGILDFSNDEEAKTVMERLKKLNYSVKTKTIFPPAPLTLDGTLFKEVYSIKVFVEKNL